MRLLMTTFDVVSCTSKCRCFVVVAQEGPCSLRCGVGDRSSPVGNDALSDSSGDNNLIPQPAAFNYECHGAASQQEAMTVRLKLKFYCPKGRYFEAGEVENSSAFLAESYVTRYTGPIA